MYCYPKIGYGVITFTGGKHLEEKVVAHGFICVVNFFKAFKVSYQVNQIVVQGSKIQLSREIKIVELVVSM